MQKYKLKNGLTILFSKNNTNTVCVEVMVKVGSNSEDLRVAGISHFLEHMMFEGTKKRGNSREIANEIEKYGAEFNAYTTGDRTAYYIKIMSKKFVKALEILSDMITNSLFTKRAMRKEKEVILKEINMVTDDPRQHQWILFQKNLFERHPARNPTYGTIETVKAITRKTLIGYYQKYYAPDNMIISIVGNAMNVRKNVDKYFGHLISKSVESRGEFIEPSQKLSKKFVEKRKIFNSYLVLGYKTASRIHKDSYTLDVINGILGRGQSGWMFDEIRNKRGLAYQVGIHNETEKDYGYFAVYCGLDKEKIEQARKIILQQFGKLQTLNESQLREAKTYLEGNHTLLMEDNFQFSDNLAFWESMKNASLANSYTRNIKKVTVADIRRVARKYFNNKYTMVVIEQE